MNQNKDTEVREENVSPHRLIELYRKCKTAAEERELMNRERAEIRNGIRNWTTGQKAEGILKLIWINMNGFETEFSQVECMNALFEGDFGLKVVGYLGLSLFLNESSEVLMMATNRIRMDLEDVENDFVVALALKAFSEIADRQMSFDLFLTIKKLLRSGSKYVRKKAVVACIRALRKCPELAEQLEDYLPSMLDEQNQGLLLCTVQLCKEYIKVKPEGKALLRESLGNINRMLKNLQSNGSVNYSVGGVNDPFLQCELLQLTMELAKGNPEYEADFGTTLLGVFNSLSYNKSATAKCLLYQVAICIMQVDSTMALKKVGVGILGDFLEAPGLNHQYTALRMLLLVSRRYKTDVGRHDKALRKYVRNSDFSIKKMALQILSNVADKENVEETLSTVLEVIDRESDRGKLRELFSIAIQFMQRNPPSLSWFEERVVDLLQALKGTVESKHLLNFYDILSSHAELQFGMLYRCALLMGRKSCRENEGLIRLCFWVIGEFYELLEEGKDPVSGAQITPIDQIKLTADLTSINCSEFDDLTSRYVLMGLSKIYVKSTNDTIRKAVWAFLDKMRNSRSVQLNIRVGQVLALLDLDEELLEEIFEPVPGCDIDSDFEGIQIGKISLDKLDQDIQAYNKGELEEESFEEETVGEVKMEAAGDDMDLLDIGGDFGEVRQPETTQNDEDDLLGLDTDQETQKPDLEDDFLDLNPTTENQPATQADDLMDLTGDVTVQQRPEQPEEIDFFGVDVNVEKKTMPDYDLLNVQNLDKNKQQETVTPQPPLENTYDALSQPVQQEPPAPEQKPDDSNPYSFLDNVHTIETIKAFQTKKSVEIDEDEFVESDVNYSAPEKNHFFENNDMMVSYSAQQVS